MTVKRHDRGYRHARRLIADGRVVLDDRDAGSEHQVSAPEENAFIEAHGYRRVRTLAPRRSTTLAPRTTRATTSSRTVTSGDVHLCAVLSAESRAGQRKYADVQAAAAHLHGMLETLRQSAAR